MMFLALSLDPWGHERAAASFQAVRELLDGGDQPRQRRLLVESLLMRARAFYSNPALAYHNWQHIQATFNAYDELWGPPEAEEMLALAYHDAIYVPGAEEGTNEYLSWKAFSNCVVQEVGNFDEGRWLDMGMIEAMILATRVSNHTSTTYEPAPRIARILDCDLVAMGAASYDVFLNTQNAVLVENVGNLWLNRDGELPLLRAKQAHFLAQFISDEREYVYRTVEAREVWEDNARRNISRFVDEWGSQ